MHARASTGAHGPGTRGRKCPHEQGRAGAWARWHWGAGCARRGAEARGGGLSRWRVGLVARWRGLKVAQSRGHAVARGHEVAVGGGHLRAWPESRSRSHSPKVAVAFARSRLHALLRPLLRAFARDRAGLGAFMCSRAVAR